MGTAASKYGKGSVEERLKVLEDKLKNVLSGKLELEIKEIAVAPRSKLRIACE